jgi:hypothetical protein
VAQHLDFILDRFIISIDDTCTYEVSGPSFFRVITKFNSRARARVSDPGGVCAGLVEVAVPFCQGLMSSSAY